MVKLRVHKIESCPDPHGNAGKRIELVEDIESRPMVFRGNGIMSGTEMKEFTQVLQQLPMIRMANQVAVRPKIILFLSEEEYDHLDVKLEVNKMFDTHFDNGAIHFCDPQE